MDAGQYKKYRMLGLNIAYYRKLRGYTQLQLAELLNIDRTHMGRVESAQVGASLDMIFNLSDILDVPLGKLFDFRD